MMDENISELESQAALEQFRKKREEMYSKGQAIVVVISVINIIGNILTAFLNFNLLTLIISIALSVALLSGVSWVRYWFAIALAIRAMQILYLLIGGNIDFSTGTNLGIVIILLLIIYTAYCIFSCIVLFSSNSVTEYMYSKKTDR